MGNKQTKRLSRTALLALLWVLLAAAAVTAATYAWFTFSPYTNVEPMSSTVSQGNIRLLICNTQDGDFAVTCALTPDSEPDDGLLPVSTADLDRFYAATAQTTEGIAMMYQTVTDIGGCLIHGTVYLKSQNGSCDVYFQQSGMDMGADSQALAALRLGLRITAQSGTKTYIFKLDDMGSTASAATTQTVPTADTVVSSLSGVSAVYTQDPSLNMSQYFAQQSTNDTTPQAGSSALTHLEADETASVEYWLYLEGCDDNCINDVQNRDLSLQLAFAGVETE
jgi:hypothetical protein